MVGIELLEYSLETFLVVCCLSGEFREKTVEVLCEYETKIERSKYGDGYLFKINGKKHRETSSLPSDIRFDGTKYWCKNGKCHRDHDLPSYICSSGRTYWSKNGVFHRDHDLPADINSFGGKRWWKNGKYSSPKN